MRLRNLMMSVLCLSLWVTLRAFDVPPPRLPRQVPELQVIPVMGSVKLSAELKNLFGQLESADISRNLADYKVALLKTYEYCLSSEKTDEHNLALWAGSNLARIYASESQFLLANDMADKTISSFQKNQDKALLPLIIRTHWVRLAVLFNMNQYEDCLVKSKELEDLVSANSSDLPTEPLAASFLFRIMALGQMSNPERLHKECLSVVSEHGDTSDPIMLGVVCMALYQKGVALVQMNRLKEALSDFELMYEKSKNTHDARLKSLIALSLFTRAGALELLGRIKEAKEAFKSFSELFKEDHDPNVMRLRDQANQWLKGHPAASSLRQDSPHRRTGNGLDKP